MSGSLELVLGGARSGKSDWASRRAEERGGDVLFVATAQARDADMRRRIAAHRASRPASWETLEEAVEIVRCLEDQRPRDVIVVDCITLWISNLLLGGASTDEPPLGPDEIERRVEGLCCSLRRRGRHSIVVSNEVGTGIVPENAIARRFRDLLGLANQCLARRADEVVLLVAGLPMVLKERNGECHD